MLRIRRRAQYVWDEKLGELANTPFLQHMLRGYNMVSASLL